MDGDRGASRAWMVTEEHPVLGWSCAGVGVSLNMQVPPIGISYKRMHTHAQMPLACGLPHTLTALVRGCPTTGHTHPPRAHRRLTEEREREKELELIKQQYLGLNKPKKRVVRPSEKFKFNFDWGADEDTSKDLNPLYATPHGARPCAAACVSACVCVRTCD